MKTAFDEYSKSYDHQFSESVIGMAQRQSVWTFLNKYLSKNKRVLEVNCGTGVDAIYMAPNIKHLDACDVSEGMIEVCQKKLKQNPCDNVRFFKHDLLRVNELIGGQYNVIFSNFAGLNCLSPAELQNFSQHTFQLLEQNGILFLVFLGKKCFWENFYFRLKRDPRLKRRQTQQGVPSEINKINFLTWYYSVNELKQIFSQYTFIESKPIGLFIPPGFMEKWFKKNGPVFMILKLLEKIFGGFGFLADYGDHTLLVMKKK